MTPTYLYDLEQGTPEWLQARLGIPTASRFDCIITPAKGEPSKQADGYMRELLAEWMSGQPLETFQSAWMARGNELEDEARRFYAFEREVEVTRCGFVLADGYGASPDGLVGDAGGVEIKVVKPSTQVSYLLNGGLPLDYKPQVMGNLLVTGREWWDFLAYSPGLPSLLVRVTRDEDYIKKLRDGLARFLDSMAADKARLIERGYGPRT